TLAEIKELLQKEQEVRVLTMEQNYALEHAIKYARLDAKDARKLADELAGIEPVSEALACKLVDLMPKHEDEVNAVFLKERTTIDNSTISQILDKVKQYL
ncbi:MAG: RNA polymerase, partial [Thermoplasmata archaeon]|nr:RNA polymerase [Thermoplasmata archaeon]